ncbi:ATP-binding cassette domain-containing protein [Lichenifustis flavocetrariae]|uniref:ATP-binding cassette domain-containing protein n=1 Tax=Lichenifustis flavocetrariae TaxID=2949735 RepID=A0AA42CGJ0_9HYPH|nr:ATP-binding cassette domain-containing protein [Lichenifustis flavocetrariae]MCW6506633.1 ATP-binding cassette domain-containing protein [Lichenifustis flavocetrariae]
MSQPAITRSGAALDVRGLSKSYGRIKALDDVSFAAERGSVTALLGLNGAGKTTLFQILTGLFVADRGTVQVLGEDFAARPTAALASMGLVFQQQVLDLDLTVMHNLAFYAGLHGLRGSVARDAIASCLGQLGLGDLGPRQVRELSGGTRRKIEIARALLTTPEILLLDEPSSGLDTGSRRALVADLFTLARERDIAVLWATHLVQEIEEASKVIVLHRGRIVAEGSPSDLMARSGSLTLEAAFLSVARTGQEGAAA